MVDFSRAEGSKNHRASFVKASNNVIELISRLQSSYEAKWVELEALRKERAAIIENTIQLLKNNKLKTTKQLGRCKNPEINEELLKILNTLPFKEKEELQYNLLRINNRFEKITTLGRELEQLEAMLSNYHINEDDYDDEVVINIGKSKKINTDKSTEVESEITTLSHADLTKVIDVHDASEELIQDLNRTLATMQKKDVEMEEFKSSLYEEEKIPNNVIEFPYNEDILASIQDEVEEAYITPTVNEKTDSINNYMDYSTNEEVEETNGECILFTITEKLTLKEIAKNVYGDEKYWKDLYNYGTNRAKLDRKASEYRVPVETVASLAGYLDNVTLKFPTELVTLEEIPQEEYYKRVA